MKANFKKHLLKQMAKFTRYHVKLVTIKKKQRTNIPSVWTWPRFKNKKDAVYQPLPSNWNQGQVERNQTLKITERCQKFWKK